MLLYGIAGAYQPSVQASIPALVDQNHFMTAHILPFEFGFRNGILIKISITADITKHIMQTHNIGLIPYVLYKIPPRTGPIKDAKEED